MPNKEGGYAANYTPTAAVDVSSGMIVDCEVIADPNEHAQTLPTVDRIEENFGQKPEAFLADTAHGTGENLAGMEQRNVTFFTPMESSQPQEGNPAQRDDPSPPVAEADWPQLPRNPQKQLDKSCFVYEEQADRYYCPQGRVGVRRDGEGHAQRAKDRGAVYRCESCEDCPLAATLPAPEGAAWPEHLSRRVRTVAGSDGRADADARRAGVYAHRMHGAETPFAHIKA